MNEWAGRRSILRSSASQCISSSSFDSVSDTPNLVLLLLSSPPMEQGARAALASLYGPTSPPDQRRAANDWLVALADKQEAWDLSLALVAGPDVDNARFFGASMLRTKLSRANASDLTQDQCTGLLGVLLGRYSEAAAAVAGAAGARTRRPGSGSALANELRACCTVTASKLDGGASALVTDFEAFGSLAPLPMLALLADLPPTLYPPPTSIGGAGSGSTRARASERAALARQSATKARDAVAVVPSLQHMATRALRDAAAAVSAATAPGAAAASFAVDHALTAIAVATEALCALKAWYAPPFVPLPGNASAPTPLSPTGAVHSLGAQSAPLSPAGFRLRGGDGTHSTGPLLALASLPAFAALCELGSGAFSGASCASAAIRRGMRRLVAASLNAMAAAVDAEADAEADSAREAEEAAEEMAARAEHLHAVATPRLAVASAYPHTAEHEHVEQQLLRVVISAAANLVVGHGGSTTDATIDEARRVRFSQDAAGGCHGSGGNGGEDDDDDDEGERDPLSDPLHALASLTAALLSRQTACTRLLARDPGLVDSMLGVALALTRHSRLAIAETFLQRRPWAAIIEMRLVSVLPGTLYASGPLAQHVIDAVLGRVAYPFTPTVKVSLLLQASPPVVDGPGDVLSAAWRQWEEEGADAETSGDDAVEQVEWLNFRNSFARDIFEACAAADIERMSVPMRDGASKGQWTALAQYFSHIASKLLPLLDPTQALADDCAWREAEALLFALHCGGGVLQSCIARESASERRATVAPSRDHDQQAKLQCFAAVDAALTAIFNVLVSLEDGGACAAAAALASGTLVGKSLVLPRNARSHPAVFLAASQAIGSYASWLGLLGGCSALRPSLGVSHVASETDGLLLRVLNVLATLLRLPEGRTPCAQQAAVAIARLSYDRSCRERLSANNAALDALVTLAVSAVPTPEEATAAAAAPTVLTTPPLRALMMPSLSVEGRHRLFESATRALASAPVVVPGGAAPWQAVVRRLFDPLRTTLTVWVRAAEASLEAAVRAGPTTATVLDLFAAAVVLLAPCNAPGLPQNARSSSGGAIPRGDASADGEHMMITLLRPVWPCWAQGMRNVSLVSAKAGRQGPEDNAGGGGGEPLPPVITSFVRFMTAALRSGPVAAVPLLPDAAHALSAAFEGGLATVRDVSTPAPAWLMPCLSGVTSLLQTFGPLLSRRVPTQPANTGTAPVDTAAVGAMLSEVLQRTAYNAGTAVLAGVGGAALAEAYLHCAHTTFMCAPDLLASAGDVQPPAAALLPQATSIAAGCVGGEGQSTSGACLVCPPGCARQCGVQRVALALLGAVARAARATTGAAQVRAPVVACAMLRGATSDHDRVQSRALLLRALLRGLADNLLADALARVADVLAPLLHLGGGTADWVLEASSIVAEPGFPSLQPIAPAVALAFARRLSASPDPFARAGSTDAGAIEAVRNVCVQFAALCRSSGAGAGDASLARAFMDETFGDGST